MYSYSDELNPSAKERYDLKLQTVGCSCPYKVPGNEWENDPTKWPQVEYGDIYMYLIESPGVYTKDCMKNYKSLEAHNFFTSGWVQTVSHIKVTKGNFVFRADVRPSYRTNEPPHHPWVATDDIGTVIAGHCDCMAGLGETCSHVAALLFKIEAAVRLGYTKQACTDQPCKWNQSFMKKVKAAKICDIDFYKSSSKKLCTGNKKSNITYSTKAQQEQFLTSIKNTDAVCLSSFSDFCSSFIPSLPAPPKFKLPIDFRTLYQPHVNFDERKMYALSSLSITREETQHLQQLTTEQSNSVTWNQFRVGRITSSVVHRVLHTDINHPSKSLIKTICCPAKSISVPAIQWGREKESEAFHQYSQVMSEHHSNFSATKSGLHLSMDSSFLGASPDGIIKCTCCGIGVLEIKCPFNFRYDDNFEQMLKQKECCLTEEFTLKQNDKYYSQVQMHMYVCDVNYCDFVLWNTNTCIITRVPRDPSFTKNQQPKLCKFWHEICLPELITRHIENGNDLQTVKNVKYCVCNQPEDSRIMIGCDNHACPIKWFHLDCVQLKRAPKGSWFCKACKASSST